MDCYWTSTSRIFSSPGIPKTFDTLVLEALDEELSGRVHIPRRFCGALENDSSVQKAPAAFRYRDACALAWPVEASSSVVASTSTVDWHAASHDEFRLITTGSARWGTRVNCSLLKAGLSFFPDAVKLRGFGTDLQRLAFGC